MFMRYKTGEANLAYPLALGMHRALATSGELEVDAIVPVPLSPDKAKLGELHRTLHLAKELGRMMQVPVVEALTLTKPISKRRLRGTFEYTASQFERSYAETVEVSRSLQGYGSILLVDDVCTEGSTLAMAATAISAENPDARIVASTAGFMVRKAVVVSPAGLLVPA
jgi:predicted amidophosphoribosyltransferase